MKKLIEALRISVHLLAVRPFLKIFFQVRTDCRYRLMDKNPNIIIANHNSHLDTLLIFSALPPGRIIRTRPVAARDYFQKNKIMYWLAGFLFNPVWIDRNEKDKTHNRLRILKDQINAGFSLILYPEGTRGLPGRIGKFKTGVGRLAKMFPHIPIVPVFLTGPEHAFPKGSRFPVPCPCRIYIGPVEHFSHTSEITTLLMERHLKQMAYYLASSKRPLTSHWQPPTIEVPGIDGSCKRPVLNNMASRLVYEHNTVFIWDKRPVSCISG
jgi:1-acyl-sn-glycerol-3-phosphate acyltransferase